MGYYYDVRSDVAEKMSDAVKNADGETASLLLKEVGSCGWHSLLKQANRPDQPVIPNSVEFNGDQETIQVFASRNNMLFPIARVTDTVCEKKR